MSMEMLNTLQFMQLLCGFLGFTVLLPALVFYRKVKHFPAAVRFLIYFTIGNFYIINLVHILELVFLSYRITLLLLTFVPTALAAVWIYRIPVVSYCKTVLEDLGHYVMRELGFRSFLLRRLQEGRRLLRWCGRHLWRLLKEVWPDIPFLAVFFFVISKVCWPGVLNNWSFGASDLPVHNYWINGLVDNQLYIAGIYPMGMHCMLYYLATVLKMPVYVTLRLFWLIQYGMIAIVLLAFLKGCSRTRFLPYLGAIGFVGLNWFVGASYSRFGGTLPQEYGMMYILPSIYFLIAYFRERSSELRMGINRIRCTSSWFLLGFAMSFSLTLTSHFYDTIIAGIICIGIVVGYGNWIWRKEYLWRILLSGILSLLMAFLPMAIAFLTGKELQGSMYWAMSIIGLRAYTVLIFRVICFGVVAITIGGTALIVVKAKRGTISFGDKPVPQPSPVGAWLLRGIEVLFLAAVLYVGWKCKDTLLFGFRLTVIHLKDNDWLLFGALAALIVGLTQRYFLEGMDGAATLSMLAAEILMGLVLVSGSLGLPVLVDPARTCVYVAYLLPVVATMTLDGAVQILIPAGTGRMRRSAAFILTAALLISGYQANLLRSSFGGGNLEMNEAILCTTNILRDNRGQNNKWTIVSANDELRMTELYGRHTEIITFLEDMEYWHENKEVVIPTDRVYFYIEKKPLNYANGYSGSIPEVSEEQAANPLPQNAGLFPYNGPRRSITMSRMYYWALAFQKLYPNEMKVYFENDRFVCYYIEQNPYRLYNFAIDYGFNSYQ